MPDELGTTWATACQLLRGANGAEIADERLNRFVKLARRDDAAREEAVRLLVRALDGDSPWEAIAFSFHKLRWPELMQALEERREAWLADPCARNIWFHLREAFDPDWQDRDLFPSLRD